MSEICLALASVIFKNKHFLHTENEGFFLFTAMKCF